MKCVKHPCRMQIWSQHQLSHPSVGQTFNAANEHTVYHLCLFCPNFSSLWAWLFPGPTPCEQKQEPLGIALGEKPGCNLTLAPSCTFFEGGRIHLMKHSWHRCPQAFIKMTSPQVTEPKNITKGLQCRFALNIPWLRTMKVAVPAPYGGTQPLAVLPSAYVEICRLLIGGS